MAFEQTLGESEKLCDYLGRRHFWVEETACMKILRCKCAWNICEIVE
jgi:hypothetical protein